MGQYGEVPFLVFTNSQGTEDRGALMHLDRRMAVFEVYNPFSILQLSEVIHGVRIHRGERIVYDGDAVVSNLITTGKVSIVTVTFTTQWRDLDVGGSLAVIGEDLQAFMSDWGVSDKLIRSDFRAMTSRVGDFLDGLSRWLDHGETVAGLDERDLSISRHKDRQDSFALQVVDVVGNKLDELFVELEDIAENISDPLEEQAHKFYIRSQIHPHILCSPFIHRTYMKPLGYAGDYEMVNMILRDPNEGGNTYARLLNMKILDKGPALGHRNRIVELIKLLKQEAASSLHKQKQFRVLSIGCGPAHEIVRIIKERATNAQWEISLLDFNEETISRTGAAIQEAQSSVEEHADVNFIHKSIHQLLKESLRGSQKTAHYDVIYCAGLFDYLSDKVCSRLLAMFEHMTRANGLIISTNVHTRNPILGFMEYLLDWHLEYRDELGMKRLAPQGVEPDIYCEEAGANVFLNFRARHAHR